MDISLIHAGLAAGAALAVLPVILHLFMKQTPKRVVFPALQLIRERQKRSQKKLKIKNWLLLLARMALVALMALALARPRLFSETSLGDEAVPTALAFVFDTSLSMGYKEKDRTRLDEAKQQALEILKKTPDSSQVFVVDSALPDVPSPQSPAAARKRIEGLALHAANRPLNAALGQAYAAVVDCEKPRHEVYVLTDLARSSWNTAASVEGLDLLKKVKSGVVTYVLQLTPGRPSDVSVVEVKPSSSVGTAGQSIEIRALLRTQGPAAHRVAEFFLDGIKKGQQPVDLQPDGGGEVVFHTPRLDPSVPLHQGMIRISGTPDPLAFDDERYFTFKVQPPRKVVIVSDLAIDAEFVRDALDPDPATLPAGTPRPYQVETVRPTELASQMATVLKDASCVFVLDVAELDAAVWGQLAGFVRDGGGLVVGMGKRCRSEHYASPNVAQLLPATPGPVEKSASPPTNFGKIHDATHPLFRRYPRELDAQLSQVPVYRYWPVTPNAAARVLLSYADNAPALLERTIPGPRTGHVLLWTTPLARRVDRRSDAAWNEFPQPSLGWSFFYLMSQTVPYLVGGTDERLMYEAGEDALVPIDPAHRYKNYVIQGPSPNPPDSQSPPVTSDALVVVAPQSLGQWSVTAKGDDGSKATLGFSVNPPLAESDLTPLKKAELDNLFGKAKYALANDPQSLERAIRLVHIGHEIFPWLMALILILVTLESFLANKFHREASGATGMASGPSRSPMGVSS